MSIVRLNRVFNSRVSCISKSISTETRNIGEYTSQPVYPPIVDISKKAEKERANIAWYNEIKALETVEEKIFKINMPLYYGWKSVILNEHGARLHSLQFNQHCTRTHFIKNNTLPDYYLSYDSAAGYIAKQLRPEIEEAIQFEYQGIRRRFKLSKEKSAAIQEEDLIAKSILHQINRILTNHLSPNLSHLMDSQIDIEPRQETFWFVGGFQSPRVRRPEAGSKDSIPYESYNHPIQYYGKPALTIRSNLPLEPIIPYSDADNESLEVPFYDLDPRSHGYHLERVHGANIPGFWPGDTHEFGLLSYHTRGYIKERTYGEEENLRALHSQGILSSFAWLMSQACYQGFSTYNDITYPLTTQTVISNGQLWSFYSYQLNTILTYGDNCRNNKLRNICYGTEPLKLFDGIDSEGKLIGFNDDVLKMLIQYYVNIPKERTDTVMKPYLGKTVKVIADIQDEEKRVWLETHYKNLVSHRPRHRLPDEIYHWEYIYKIKFNTRIHEPKRRPFELRENPYKRRLDEHTPAYIPKVLRVHPKSKKKWEKTYYP